MPIQIKFTLKSNTKVWDQIKKRMAGGNKSVDVGWFSTERYANGVPIAWIALLNEYGHINGGKYAGSITPPRPFFRLLFKAYNSPDVTSLHMVPLLQKVALGKMSWTAFYKEVGNNLVELVKEKIVEYKSPPNSPLTISLKGFNDPLIETKTMLNTVRYRISRSKRGTD